VFFIKVASSDNKRFKNYGIDYCHENTINDAAAEGRLQLLFEARAFKVIININIVSKRSHEYISLDKDKCVPFAYEQ